MTVSTSPTAPAAQPRRDRDFFGHPAGLSYLFSTELWERFSYYGMRALLVLYLVKYLLIEGRADHVLALNGLRGSLGFGMGAEDNQPFASNIYGFYTGLVYLSTIFGGILADRLLGKRRTVVIGCVLMAMGHFCMAVESLLLPAMALLVLGSGAFKANISSQVGGLYQEGDRRIDRAFNIFYMGTNIGAFLAPLICGTLAEEIGFTNGGFHYGFGAAGVGMLVALAIYMRGWRYLPPDPPLGRLARERPDAPVARTEGEGLRIGTVVVTTIISVFWWAVYEQQGNTLALWIADYTDRHLIPGFSVQIPVTWFQFFNPLMIFLFTPFLVRFWAKQNARGTEPGTVRKLAIGALLVGLANLLMVIPSQGVGETASTSWFWLLGFFLLITIGELYLSPTSMALVSKVSPARMVAMMMGVNFLANFLGGGLLAGWLGGFWSRMPKSEFFLMMGGIALGAAVAFWLVERPLRRILNE